MGAHTLRATGGFCPPTHSFALPALRIALRDLPPFTASRGGIRFEDPAERWAREREREMRALTRMWDWP